MSKKDIIICRCEDVSLEDIHKVLNEGFKSIEEIKRILRVGMGACQGNTCNLLIQREVAKFYNIPLQEVKLQKVRPLITGVKLKSIVESTNES